MSDLQAVRSVDVIAAEINTISDHAKKVFLESAVEIGRRLVEAKEQLQHGEWGAWLEEKVNYSQSTANNLMNVYREYGDKIAMLGNLSYTKAVALLGVPAEEREDFLQEHDPDGNKSARELQDLIKERKMLAERAATLEKRNAELSNQAEKERKAREKLQQQSEDHAAEVERLKAQIEAAEAAGDSEEVQNLRGSLENAESVRDELLAKIKQLEEDLKAKPFEAVVVDGTPQSAQMEQELEDLRRKLAEQSTTSEAAAKFKAHLESIAGLFEKLLGAVDEIPEDSRSRYKAAAKALAERMAARLQ